MKFYFFIRKKKSLIDFYSFCEFKVLLLIFQMKTISSEAIFFKKNEIRSLKNELV